MDLANNRIKCSLNNSLLSFSAPEWLGLIYVYITFSAYWVARKLIRLIVKQMLSNRIPVTCLFCD